VAFISEQCLGFNGRYLKCADALQQAGMDVETVVLAKGPTDKSSAITHIQRPNWGQTKIGTSLAYRALKNRALNFIKRQNYDVYHAMDYVSLEVAAQAKARFGGKIVFDACEIFTETAFSTPELKVYIQKLFDKCAQAIDVVLTPSTYLGDTYAKLCPQWPKAQIISNAPAHKLEHAYDGRMHRALGLEASEKILLYHGAFSVRRGLRDLVDSAHALPSGYWLVLMGYGALEIELKAAAQRVNRRANRQVVRFLDPVPNAELLDWICGAHYGLIPYEDGPLNHTYCTPNKLYEYPAAGVPLITTRLLALEDVINTYEIGQIIAGPLTGKKIRLWLQTMNDDKRCKLVNNCKKMTSTTSWTKNADRLQGIYEGLFLKA